MAYKDPPKGYVINDGDYGAFFIGEDEDVARQRQIELHAASDACIKLFKDGGFEIQSQSTAKLGDNIVSRSADGLFIKGNNIHLDAGNGEITLSARSIKFESTGNDEPFIIRSSNHVLIEADDNIKVDGSTVAIGARTNMLLRSPGPIYINSSAGVSIVEPKVSLCPKDLLNFVQTLATNIFGY